jgi:hypothetical protein
MSSIYNLFENEAILANDGVELDFWRSRARRENEIGLEIVQDIEDSLIEVCRFVHLNDMTNNSMVFHILFDLYEVDVYSIGSYDDIEVSDTNITYSVFKTLKAEFLKSRYLE